MGTGVAQAVWQTTCSKYSDSGVTMTCSPDVDSREYGTCTMTTCGSTGGDCVYTGSYFDSCAQVPGFSIIQYNWDSGGCILADPVEHTYCKCTNLHVVSSRNVYCYCN